MNDAPTIHERLVGGAACLERLDVQRSFRGDLAYGKAIEEQIVRDELLDLELQDIDEQIRRICDEAGDPPAA